MKKLCITLALLCALMLFCLPAVADEAGVLTETEVSTWLNQVLLSTLSQTPLNAPIGEESLTEDGYAFLYSTVTLYYDKPVLDAQSVLNALVVTDEALDMPRGIRLGAPVQMLFTAYGWQNPTLAGDESFAPLYTLNQLPDSAYWAWAQRSGAQLQSVQCGIHARMGEDSYTDTGILYTVQQQEVSAIRVYGLSASVGLAQVESNLAAVGGSGATVSAQAVAGVTVQSSADAFTQSDLQFARMDFLTLTDKGAATLLGEPTGQTWAQEETGAWLQSLAYKGATMVFAMDSNRENARLVSLTITDGQLAGPRGLMIGADLDSVISLFRSDGTGAVSASAALLYGDGQTTPYGTLERNGGDATLRYAASVTGADGVAYQVALHLTFVDEQLAEMMIYRL